MPARCTDNLPGDGPDSGPHAPQHSPRAPGSPAAVPQTASWPDGVRLIIPADATSVRQALRALLDTLMLRSLTDDRRGAVEIVLAEVLNNVVEHAYSRQPGTISINLHLGGSDLTCVIEDTGKPMPDGRLPPGHLHPKDELGNPAEGGFGWHLIRSLSRDLDYRRIDGRNLLSFRLDTEQ